MSGRVIDPMLPKMSSGHVKTDGQVRLLRCNNFLVTQRR